MSRRLATGVHEYRGHTIIRRHYETASVFKDGVCIACGFSTIQRSREWIDEKERTMINARPSNGGNTAEHFREAYRSLTEAEMAVKNAIIDVDLNIMHGRNYQHIPPLVAADMRKADLARLDGLRNALTDIAKLKLDIANAIGGE